MKYFTFLLFFIFFLSTTITAQNDLSDEVMESIHKRLSNEINPSIAIGIIDENGPRYYNYGVIKKGGKEVNEHTIYEIGSISKVFTGILLAHTELKGKVKVDDAAQSHLPDGVTLPMRNGEHITLGHLSDHTSSLPRMPTNFTPTNPGNPYADYTVEQMYEFISDVELERDIGSEYEYSNLAQGLLGHILELKAKKKYEELMIDVIAKPLGMNETKVTFDQNMKNNLAIGHNQGVEAENWDIPALAGAGAIRSSTHDMLRFLATNMGMTDHKIQKAMKQSHQVRHDKGGSMRLGLGWHIAQGADGDVIWHNGGTGGYRAFAGFVNETKTGVVVLTNSTEGVDDIGFKLLDRGSSLRDIRPHIAAEVRKAIDEKGVEAAIRRYNDLKASNPDDYDFGENEMNSLGYYYMEKNLPAALAIFKLNVEEHPKSFNVWDSYGEALMNNGQNELAIENYKKSLEINPGNTGGITMLKKMGVDYEAKDADVTQEVMDSYVGKYELAPAFHIDIRTTDGRLFGQATGQSEFELFPSSDTEWYLKVVTAQIVFSLNNEGKVEKLTLFQSGQEMPGKKVE